MKKIIILFISILSFSTVIQGQSQFEIDLNRLESDIQIDLSQIVVDLDSPHQLQNLVVVTTNSANLESNYYNYSYSTSETSQDSDLFNKLSKVQGVDVVYISKSLLGMMPKMDMPGVDIGNVAGKLESLEIYSTESSSATKSIVALSKSLLKSNDYETLMLIKDKDSQTAFYIKKAKGNSVSEMFMVAEEEGEATIIRFLGDFSVQDIKNITNKNYNTSSSPNSKSRNVNNQAKAAEQRTKAAEQRVRAAEQRAKVAERRAKAAEQRAEQRAKRAEQRAKAAEQKAEERVRQKAQ